MWNKISYRETGRSKEVNLTSSVVVIGEDTIHTAMAKTVGRPMGIAAKLYMTGKIGLTGGAYSDL
jgi:hypothetical protein